MDGSNPFMHYVAFHACIYARALNLGLKITASAVMYELIMLHYQVMLALVWGVTFSAVADDARANNQAHTVTDA